MDNDPQSLQNLINYCSLHGASRKMADWKSTLRHSTILSVNGMAVYTMGYVIRAFNTADKDGMKTTTVQVAPVKKCTKESVNGYLPKLQVDQMRIVTRHLRNMNDMSNGYHLIEKNAHLNVISGVANDFDDDLIPLEILRVMSGETHKLLQAATTSKKKVELRKDWPKLRAAESKQLDKHFGHNFYGDPIPLNQLPQGCVICHQTWSC